jgi:flavin reductase (DIM6/NTAB) family NADH-FMN oxidoreductase RutF
MIAAGVPPPIIAEIVRWASSTTAKMAARYGHFGIEQLRTAADAMSQLPVQKVNFEARSLEFSLEKSRSSRTGAPN